MDNNKIITETFSPNEGIVNIQENERQRIARDLHDTSLQNLAHLVHELELCSLYMDTDIIKAKLEIASIKQNLKTVIEEIRGTIFDLRPMSFDDLGLKESVEILLSKVSNDNKNIKIKSDLDNVSHENNIYLLNIYRFIQEACNNVTKHANATELFISMKNRGDYLEIEISDNGVGFSIEDQKKANHFGLSVMKSRIEMINGIYKLETKQGKGTSIYVKIPI